MVWSYSLQDVAWTRNKVRFCPSIKYTSFGKPFNLKSDYSKIYLYFGYSSHRWHKFIYLNQKTNLPNLHFKRFYFNRNFKYTLYIKFLWQIIEIIKNRKICNAIHRLHVTVGTFNKSYLINLVPIIFLYFFVFGLDWCFLLCNFQNYNFKFWKI